MLSILNKRGGKHNSCEDSILVIDNKDFIQGGVFDGCSSGTDSQWASKTVVYILQSIIKKGYHLSDRTAVLLLMNELKSIKDRFGLTNNHFLSTMLIFYYSKALNLLMIIPFGDGVYYINGIKYVIEQNNFVDYIGDNLELVGDNLINYIYKHSVLTYTDVDNFQICSDGISAIIPNQFIKPTHNPDILLQCPTSENYLDRMHNILIKNKYEFKDDISIISYFNNKHETT